MSFVDSSTRTENLSIARLLIGVIAEGHNAALFQKPSFIHQNKALFRTHAIFYNCLTLSYKVVEELNYFISETINFLFFFYFNKQGNKL